MSDKKEHKLWGGRFSEPTDQLLERINASIGFDKRLFAQDTRASQAHASMLARQGIIGPEEAKAMVQGLEQVRSEIAQGNMVFDPAMEDIHTHVEARLGEIMGPAAGRLHTARSRNDQVATDLRLWALDAGQDIDAALTEVQRALVEVAEKHASAIMPGYTHMQRAQPVLLAHHLLAYVHMLWRDRGRLADCAMRTAHLPLGAAALAGTGFPVDPGSVAADLGLGAPSANSMDAVSDRDFVAETLFVLAMIQVHLSRLAEEMVLWSTQEFRFITLSDAFTTGSSIMPQKKNPDACELVRGKTGRAVGNLIAVMVMLKGQPLAYNKDLQEDKEPLFDSVDNVLDCLKVMAPMLRSMQVHEDSMRRAVKEGFLNATELADYWAGKGVPFREAHGLTGRAVRLAEDKGVGLEDLSLDDLKGICELTGEDVFAALTPERAVEVRTSPGGTAPGNVTAALKEARKRLWPEE